MDDEVVKQILAVQGYTELGLFADAQQELDLIDQDLEVVGMLRCDLFSRQFMWREMRDLAERLARSAPENSQCWISWAYAARRLESVDAARAILIEARKSHPNEAVIIYNLACYASVSGDYEEARKLLKQATDLDPVCKEMAMKDEDLEPLFRI